MLSFSFSTKTLSFALWPMVTHWTTGMPHWKFVDDWAAHYANACFGLPWIVAAAKELEL